MTADRWIFGCMRKPECKYRIFCIPYAGSGASLYSAWDKYFDNDIEIDPIQLPGRENHRKEPFINDMNIISEKIADLIASMSDKPFALFGYSMGGVISYEVVLKLLHKYNLIPDVLFMGASSVFGERDFKVSELAENDLIKYLERIGGSDNSAYESELYRNSYLPIIRNDYRLLERYHFGFEPLPCRIVSFASKTDKAMLYRNIRLLSYMTDNWEVYEMQGNHFFIHDKLKDVTDIVKQSISI